MVSLQTPSSSISSKINKIDLQSSGSGGMISLLQSNISFVCIVINLQVWYSRVITSTAHLFIFSESTDTTCGSYYYSGAASFCITALYDKSDPKNGIEFHKNICSAKICTTFNSVYVYLGCLVIGKVRSNISSESRLLLYLELQ